MADAAWKAYPTPVSVLDRAWCDSEEYCTAGALLQSLGAEAVDTAFPTRSELAALLCRLNNDLYTPTGNLLLDRTLPRTKGGRFAHRIIEFNDRRRFEEAKEEVVKALTWKSPKEAK